MKKKILLSGLILAMGIGLIATGISPPNTNVAENGIDVSKYNRLEDAFVEYANWSYRLEEATDYANVRNFLTINNIANNGSIYYTIDNVSASSLNTDKDEYLQEIYTNATNTIQLEDEEYNRNITDGEERYSQRLSIISDNMYKLSEYKNYIGSILTVDGSGNVSNIQDLENASDLVIVAGNMGTETDYVFGILINDGDNKYIYSSGDGSSNSNLNAYVQDGYTMVPNVPAFLNSTEDSRNSYFNQIVLMYAGGYTTEQINYFITEGTLFGELGTMLTSLNSYQSDNCQHLFHITNQEQANCMADGVREVECEVCGYTASYQLSSSERTHADLITYSSDDPDERGSVISQCGEPVYMVKECLACHNIEKTNLTTKDEYGNDINVLKDHNYQKIGMVVSTCVSNGKIIYKCLDCSESYEVPMEIDAGNHTNVTYETVEEPTCMEQGYKIYHCGDCDTTMGEKVYIDALDHEWAQTSTTTGDCKVSSSITYTCNRCGETKTENGQTGTVHNENYVKERIKEEPTCTTEGVIEIYCLGCDEVISTKSIPMINHNYDGVVTAEASCITRMETTFTCKTCGDSYVTVGDIAEDKHISSNWHEKEKATCSSYGEEALICDECGVQISSRQTGITEHTYEEEITKKPTCSSYGESSIKCTICGDIKSTQKLAKTDHMAEECEDGVVRCSECSEELGYIVIYDANGGICEKSSDYGETGKSINLPVPTREGYVFNGWYNELGVKITSLRITGNINLKAMWTSLPIKITYNADGGQSSEATQTYYAGDTWKLPVATRNGYRFEGWYINDELLINGETISFMEPVVATAKWTKVELSKPKVIKATKTSLTVEPVEGAVGYQVYISPNTKFKPRNSYSSTRTTINVSEMTRKGTYIAIRTVGKDSAGKYVYSVWKYYKY